MNFLNKPEKVEEYVCTEVSACRTEWGRQLVLNNMVHTCGPFCYTKFHQCSCNRERCLQQQEPCRKRFPFCLKDATSIDPTTGTIHHRRREEQDRLTVEFNETLLRMWDGHANVKVTSTATIISYLFGYCFKGNDKAEYILQKEDTGSPLLAYKRARYLSAMEAVWRGLSFQNVYMKPAVHVLEVTIPYALGGQVEAHRKKITQTKNAKKAVERGTLSHIASWFYRPAVFEDMTPHEYHETCGMSPQPFPGKNLVEGVDFWRDSRPTGGWYIRKHPKFRAGVG